MSKSLSRFCAVLPVLCIVTGGPILAQAKRPYIPWGRDKFDAPNAPMVKSTSFSTSAYAFSLAWSPDGETLAVGESGSIVLYSGRGQILKTYSALPGAFQPDATSEKPDDPLGIQDAATPTYPVTGLWWSPDGKSLAARVDEVGLPIWNTETDQVRFVLGDHKGGTLSLAWSPKSDMIATGGVDTLITLFDASTGKVMKTLDSHLFPVRQLAFGKTDDEIVSLGIREQYGPQNTEIKHWSIAKATPVAEIMQDYGCTFSALSPRGDVCSLAIVGLGGGSKPILLCDTTTGQTITAPYGPIVREGAVHLFSPSGNTFTVYFFKGGIRQVIGGPIYFSRGAQTYFTKGAEPIMGFYNTAKSLVPASQLPVSSATISKNGMLATSYGKTIEIWGPSFN